MHCDAQVRKQDAAAWRSRLGQDGALLGTLTRQFVQTVQAFYAQRAAASGVSGAKTGAVTVVQRPVVGPSAQSAPARGVP
jgi:hypothetical protein